MDIFNFFFYDVLYRPLYNLVVFTYQTLPGHDMGLTIIYLALLVRVALLPASMVGSASARRMEELRPQLEKLRRMPEVGRRRSLTRKLLKQHRINIYATAMVLLAQVAFLAILFQVFQSGFHHDPNELAYFTVHGPIDTTFFGMFDLAERNWWLPLTAAVALYVLLWLTTPEPEPGAKLSDVWYVIVLPLFVFGVLLLLPSAKALFLLVSILFSIGFFVVGKYVFRVEPSLGADPE
ncbi:MAG: YidC/Oxa1 family membrane protein insertase [bacterium]|nr:YidC/Oxa1 family membrane protein insertase [bacterium]MDZ4248034.1 YidC/Oxa1 family membrane protein insertase [Patescibacteria group bacterium]